MARTIQQTVEFRVPPETLFDVYMDSKAHSAAIGAKASVSRRVGGRFTAFGRALLGRNLAIVPRRMIVQSWRGSSWKRTDLDSVLILTFRKVRGGGRITLVHANVPDTYHASIRKGWNTYYWKRWKAYLAKPATRARRRQ
ncbi:MAG: SRPBCC domain-containing protein [Candidatus Rokubacteria bacterium]|nr:SRPBCC domain-containing protein [Candidatus Rokubacteria bacterium]